MKNNNNKIFPAEEKMNKPVFIPGKPSSREQKDKENQEVKISVLPVEIEVIVFAVFFLFSITMEIFFFLLKF